jgi:hypothetical protein
MSDPLFAEETYEVRFRRIEKQLAELMRTPRVANITTIVGGIQTDEILTAETTSSVEYDDLDPDNPGPTVSVQVLGTGRLLVLGSALVSFTPATSGGPHGGQMAIAHPIGVENLIHVELGNVPVALSVKFTQASTFVLENLNPGTVELQLKYKALSGTAAPVTFSNRVLAVLPL